MQFAELSDLYDLVESNSILRRVAGFRPQLMSPELIDAVRNKCQSKELTLVLGAGVSQSVGILGWNALVERLATDTYGTLGEDHGKTLIRLMKSGDINNIVLVRHLEQQLKFKSAMKKKLRHLLYEQLDTGAFEKLLIPICKYLLMPDVKNRVDSVISYNFDSLIERVLRGHGCNPKSVYSHATYRDGRAPLVVYHPHGFLPHYSDYEGDVDEPLVFSEPDYHAHYLDANHWANILQKYHLMHRSCLFIGVSLNDPNMRRLLDSARKSHDDPWHYSIQAKKGDDFQSALIEQDHYSLGVRVIWVDSREKIPVALEAIAR